MYILTERLQNWINRLVLQVEFEAITCIAWTCVRTYKNINLLKPKFVEIINNRTSKGTQAVTITNINLLTLFREIIRVYAEYRTGPINIKCGVTDR
jgi:hypothetical protein